MVNFQQPKPRLAYILTDDRLPRSIFWQYLHDGLREIFEIVGEDQDADYYFPYEDIYCEWNWPKHATQDANYVSQNQESNFIKGHSREIGTLEAWQQGGLLIQYVEKIIEYAHYHPDRKVIVVCLHPWYALGQYLRPFSNIYYFKNSLATHELSIMPRSISFPTLPIAMPQADDLCQERNVLASFQGVNSHMVREKLMELAQEKDFFITIKDKNIHDHLRLDAQKQQIDASYNQLMGRSQFALVPRGDALYSYRLAEAMAFQTIPVIISDGWVLPFHRSLPWHYFSLHLPSDRIPHLAKILRRFNAKDIEEMRRLLRHYHTQSLKDMTVILRQAFHEVKLIDAEINDSVI